MKNDIFFNQAILPSCDFSNSIAPRAMLAI